MTYRSILVGIDIDAPGDSIIALATELATRFHARLIGASAADIAPPIVTPDGIVLGAEIMQNQRDDIESRLDGLRRKFEALAGAAVDVEWRAAIASPTRLLLETVRAADLVLIASPEGASGGNPYRSIDLGSLALNAGRPLLVAASGAEHLPASRVLVAWKDTREARRAVADAVPLMAGAREVVVATVDREADILAREGIADVVAFLARHGIKARSEVIAEKDDAKGLAELARSMNADLVVSGAYGHSRLREWVFGGVTRSLLDDGRLNRFMSS
jgi:nucleotide-binding universal stress UspA family protein